MANIINRESGKQSKGFRLQRLRAVKLLLREMEESGQVHVLAATEYMDDVYLTSANGSGIKRYAEGDKNYDSKQGFSFMSAEVTNSLASFLDCWIDNKMSQVLVFGFYTNVGCARENQTDRIRRLGVTLPDKPILDLLINRDYTYANLLETIKIVLVDEYKRQYGRHSEQGHLHMIQKFNDAQWIDFLSRIDWQFDQENERELERTILEQIANCKLYSSRTEGKESHILAGLLNLFEQRQNLDDHLLRLVSDSDVKTVFLEIATNNYEKFDPVWEEWEGIDPPLDKRNLPEKISAVCEIYSDRKIGILARKVSAVRREFKKIDFRHLGSYRYRVLLSCEEQLDNILRQNEGPEPVSQEVVDDWIDQLSRSARDHLEDKSKDYTYPLKSDDSLYNTVLELFDSCFLAFDMGETHG